jgi:threonine aldolase
MIQFQCDYNEGAHPKVMQRLMETNMEQTVGYGEDHYCEAARRLIQEACGNPKLQVHFLVGGTQTNTTVIAHLLRPHQGVIAAESGHISVHETGAIEHTGHKVLALPAHEGKITAAQVENLVLEHRANSSFEHTVQPGMVYISFPTEFGTLYTKTELEALHEMCRKYELPLFIDGARMGYGLASPACDVTLSDIARLADVFYIGGTKVGALFGEAVVSQSPALMRDFRYSIKQHGGMLAKGRLLGLQFEALFTDNLYFDIARHAVSEALRIKKALQDLGVPFLMESHTNQQFPILPNDVVERLNKNFLFTPWQRMSDTHTAIRICTSWGTTTENVDTLITALTKELS